jgi:hypothetical protein
MRLLRVSGLCRSGFIREENLNRLTVLQDASVSVAPIHLGYKPEMVGLALCNT